MDNYTHSPQKPLRAFVDESTEDVYEIEVDPVDDAIEALLSDVEAELEFDSFNENTLFDHFIVTLHRLFSIVRYEYGKPAKNLSTNDIDEFVTLYWLKFNQMLPSHRIKEVTKYDYDTYYEHFANISFPRSARISIYDYIFLTTGKSTQEEIEDSEKQCIKRIYGSYLPNFFGIKYNDKRTDRWKYEVIRLIKILYDCTKERKVISLLCIQHPSLVKFNPLLRTNYTDAVKFIKSRVILRECYASTMTPLHQIVHMEQYVDALQSFLQSISYKSIDYIIQHIKGKVSCAMKRSICHELYRTITHNISTIPLKHHIAYNHLEDPNAIPYYAYMHFILSGINDHLLLMESSNAYYPTVSSDFYDKATLLPCEIIEDDAVFFSYMHEKKSEITKLLDEETISWHMENYQFLYTFIKKLNINKSSSFSSKDILYIIKFYETVYRDKIDIPLSSGYTKNHQKPLKINMLLKKMHKKHLEGNDTVLSDESYLIASLWLQDRIISFWDMRTAVTQLEMCKMQHMILEVWENYFPRLTYQDNKSPSLNEFVAQILPENDLQRIIARYSA